MKYMLLIYDEEKRFETMTEAEGRQLMGEYGAIHPGNPGEWPLQDVCSVATHGSGDRRSDSRR